MCICPVLQMALWVQLRVDAGWHCGETRREGSSCELGVVDQARVRSAIRVLMRCSRVQTSVWQEQERHLPASELSLESTLIPRRDKPLLLLSRDLCTEVYC